MKILLDIDDTVFMNGRLHSRFFEFKRLVKLNKDEVTVWSAHEDGEAIAALMGFPFISKNNSIISPTADVLIDDCGEQFIRLCSVINVYASLEDFLNAHNGS